MNTVMRVSMAATMMLAAASGTALAKERLTYGSYLPPSHSSSKGIQAFIDTVKTKTNGDIVFEFYPSGSIASGKTSLSAIQDGLMDGGMLVNLYFPTEVPINSIINDMSFWNADTRVISAAISDTVVNDCPQCLAEFTKHNVHFLATYGAPPYNALCAAKPEGFTLKGKRMRVAGEDMGRWAQSIGAIPVNIPNSESYEAMQRKQVDCVIGAVSWLSSLSLVEVTETVLEMPMGAFQGGSLLNVSEEVWKRLSAKDRGILEDAAIIGIARTVYAYLDEEKVARVAAEKKGITFLAPSKEMSDARAAFQELQRTQSAKTAAGRGVKDGSKVAEALIANIAKWQKLIDDAKPDEAAYVQMLRTKIWGK
ncbi:C4-dicarboxylate TRAP transporter substrate-binding protein [Oleispirillum naphthae]|uniref:C4-dicarboxylate TRAP transporter substrate-binding protein n=1 Tax=Oleispirillum naphthae TaxID=2838853 RepID=UPI00308224FE